MVADTQVNDPVEHIKTQFLASLNHEIRTPLSGIIGMTDLLMETTLDSEQKEYVSATRLCAESLLETLNATLEYSALAAGTTVIDDYEYSLSEALEMTVAEHFQRARAKGLRIFLTYEESLPETILGDARRMRQMISQIVANAVKFTSEGCIEVRADKSPEGELQISVRDTGVGIPHEKLDHIFDSFRQADTGLSRSHAGLGLGLALANRIADLCCGRILVTSKPSVGSTFTVQMPIRLPATEPVEPAETYQVAASASCRRLLLVEDNPVSQTVVTHLLRRFGYEIECASSGAEALSKSAARRYDLVLMDLQMPEMDGLETTSLLRKLQGYDRTPVIALTANYSDVYRDMSKEYGMQAFLSKPVQSSELLSTIRKYLR